MLKPSSKPLNSAPLACVFELNEGMSWTAVCPARDLWPAIGPLQCGLFLVWIWWGGVGRDAERCSNLLKLISLAKLRSIYPNLAPGLSFPTVPSWPVTPETGRRPGVLTVSGNPSHNAWAQPVSSQSVNAPSDTAKDFLF